MIPKTELRGSLIYNKKFNKNFSIKDYRKLMKDSEEFEKLYKKYIKKILQLIEKHHNKTWKRKFISIYIVKNVISFSDPLTLRYFENPKMMLVILAHELLHNNSFGKKKFNNSYELHKYMEPILNKVIRDLPLDLEKELEILNKKTIALSKKK